MNTQLNRNTIGGVIIPFVGALVLAITPEMLAAELPPGAKCVNGVVVALRHGPASKDVSWILPSHKCDMAEFNAMESDTGIIQEEERTDVHGKPGYTRQPGK